MDSGDRSRVFDQLRARYAARLPQRTLALREQLEGLGRGADGPAERQSLLHQTHNLAGSANTFGYHSIGDLARRLDLRLRELIADGVSGAVIAGDLGDAARDLERLAKMAPDQQSDLLTTPILPIPAAEKVVWVVDDDETLAEEIVRRLAGYGYQAKAYANRDQVESALKSQRPAAMLIDQDLGAGMQGGPEVARSVRTITGEGLPLVFFSVHESWPARLSALRAGSSAYLSKPLDFPQLVEVLDRLTGQREAQPYKILVLDDVEELAQHHAMVLRAAGMEAHVFFDPFAALENLPELKPDLVLTDLYMPTMSGVEFAGVVRQKALYDALPIIFLSHEVNVGDQLAALRVGGDEFLIKPIRADHLIAAVSIRAARFRTLNALMSIDALTGLLSPISTRLRLEEMLPLALRRHAPLCFVMIDVDHFKQVNDRFGHPAGDRVLRMLARLLKQCVRQSDIVGRFGGEEFALVLPDTAMDDAARLVDSIRLRFASLSQQHGAEVFHVTFSAGLSCSTKHALMPRLIEAADQALYLAKASGRDCVREDPGRTVDRYGDGNLSD
jgi:diguanylate cyclase (GGDEF)-like protein